MSNNSPTIKSILLEILQDAKQYGETKLELLELQLMERSAPRLASALFWTLYTLLVVVAIILLFITGGLALSLIFTQSPEATDVIRSLTFGFLCTLAILTILLVIFFNKRKSINQSTEGKIINSHINAKEAKELEESMLEPASTTTDEPTQPEEQHSEEIILP